MKANSGAIKKLIGGEPYLIPYGQMIEQNAPAIKLSEFGELVWDMLQEDIDIGDIIVRLCQHFEASANEQPIIAADLNSFLNQLRSCGYLANNNTAYINIRSYCIAGIKIVIKSNAEINLPQLADFAQEYCEPDLSIELTTSSSDVEHKDGTLLLAATDAIVSSHPDGLHLFYPTMSKIRLGVLSHDYSYCRLHISPIISKGALEEIFQAIRFPFLMKAAQSGLFAMHSASILYNEKLWLFSGSSGTGKSTHTRLWHMIYETPYVNGDLNLLGMTENGIKAYGIPWCGTSGISSAKDYDLGGVVMLSQSKENIASKLSSTEATRYIYRRFITPTLYSNDMSQLVDMAASISDAVPVFSLACNMDDEAAHVMKAAIDAIQ